MRLTALLLMCLTALPPVRADKVTSDPNARPVVSADAALARRVGIGPIYCRLQEITAELSKKTGLDIRCGRDDSDWRVRDIPVAVSASDLPVGTLLRSIAGSAHLTLSREKRRPSTSSGRSPSARSGRGLEFETPIYRLWRDSARTRDIDAYFDSKRSVRETLTAWSWDALVAASRLGREALRPNTAKADELSFLLARELGACLAIRSPENRAVVLKGERIKMYAYESPTEIASAIENGASHAAQIRLLEPEMSTDDIDGKRTSSPRDIPDESVWSDLSDARFRFDGNTGEAADIHLEVSIGARGWNFSLIELATRVSRALTPGSLPKRPNEETITRPLDPRADASLKTIADDNWDIPMLQAKLTVPRPADGKMLACADLIGLVSEAAGISIVAEDFESHKREQKLDVPVGQETTAGAVLKALSDRFTWLVDTENKLVVGWSRVWPERHRNLMPVKLLDDLHDKLNGDGVYLDDAVPLAEFTSDAHYEWIYLTPRLSALRACIFPGAREPWVFYHRLKARDRKLAWSEAGLPLAKFDPALVCRTFGIEAQDLGPDCVFRALRGSSIQLGRFMVYASFTLKDGTLVHPHWSPAGLPKQEVYHISVDGKKANGENLCLKTDGPCQPLPVFSKEREAELLKELGASGAAR